MTACLIMMAIALVVGVAAGVVLGLAFAGVVFGVVAKLLSMGATYRDDVG
jgi:hypothetical protein